MNHAAQVHDPAPEFNEKLVSEFKGYIEMIIREKVHNMSSSDMCYEFDDLYNECLVHLWEATKKFDPTRGAKFKTYAIMTLKSRIGSFRHKVSRKNSNQTVCFSDIEGGWGICGVEDKSEDGSSISSHYSSFTASLSGGIDAQLEMIDAKAVSESLTGHRKILFEEFYINGRTIKEICEMYTDLKYHQIRRHMKYLEKIYQTLIVGEPVCH